MLRVDEIPDLVVIYPDRPFANFMNANEQGKEVDKKRVGENFWLDDHPFIPIFQPML